MNEHDLNTCPVPKGILLIIGGHENKNGKAENEVQRSSGDPREILKTFIKLLDKESPRIEVITTASAEGNDTFNDYRKAFADLGIHSLGHIHHDKRADVQGAELFDRIRSADGIFLSGGDQLKLTALYGGTEFLVIIKERYVRDRIIIAGTSAGAMALSTPMIYSGTKEKQQLTGEIKVTTGLEFVKDVCIDTHFVDRGRFVRMSQVIATNPTCIGIGIEEDTALIIREGINIEVVGSGVVIVIDGFSIGDSNVLDFDNHDPVYIDHLNVKLLSSGRKYVIPQKNPRHV